MAKATYYCYCYIILAPLKPRLRFRPLGFNHRQTSFRVCVYHVRSNYVFCLVGVGFRVVVVCVHCRYDDVRV